MAKAIHEFTAGALQKKALWIAKVWRDIPQDMIITLFLRCSILNSLYRTKMAWYSVYESLAESSADELDNSFIQELFTCDNEESDFEEI